MTDTMVAQETITQDSHAPEQTDFLLRLLADLRKSGYRPRGWWQLATTSWRESRAVARAHPRLIESWSVVATGLTMGDAAALVLEARSGDREAALRALPGVALSLAFIHLDTYMHLGMNAAEHYMPPADRIGVPTTLTLVRRTIAGFVWAHLLGRRPLTSTSTLSTLLVAGAASDVIDGAVARRRGQVTRLGAYLDAEADFSFWASLALTLGAQGRLPRWLILLLFMRFGAPAFFAALSYLVLHRPAPVGSTIAGKAAAVAQMAAFGSALAPRHVSRRLDRAYSVLHVITAGFLLVAPVAQAFKILLAPLSRKH